MTRTPHDLALAGCVSSVLASYLKALAVHRLVAEQVDAGALSHWDADGVFHLESTLDRAALVDFFLERYRPTPLVTPWNGGAGFVGDTSPAATRAVATIEASTDPRFAAYRDAIAGCRRVLLRLGPLDEDDGKDGKLRLLTALRAELPDDVVPWLDAAYVAGEEARYPALLGTGANDGRLEFASNFMQRLDELLLAGATARRSAPLVRPRLEAALFGSVAPRIRDQVPAGQFVPGAVGGTNMTVGIGGGGGANPWDFVLALEGSVAFAGAAVRRLDTEQRSGAAFPFHVGTSAVGYGSSSEVDADKARGELWLPLWGAELGGAPRPVAYAELLQLFGEGRLQVGRRRAASGLDAVRALASLGVERGVGRFERFGFFQRNGRSFLAIRLGTHAVRRIPAVDLLRDLDAFASAARRLDRPSPALAAAVRALDEAMFDACADPRRMVDVLAAVGALERALSRSAKAREAMRPLDRLSPEWVDACDDGSPEVAIALAVASWRGVRSELEPVAAGRWTLDRPTWGEGSALRNVVAVARRRLVRAAPGELPLEGRSRVTPSALAALLESRLDERRLADLLFGLAIVEPRADERPTHSPELSGHPAFSLLRAVTSPTWLAVDGRHPAPRLLPTLLARVEAADLAGALELAAGRLRASGCHVRVMPRAVAPPSPTECAALAAALVVPLPRALERQCVESVVLRSKPTLRPTSQESNP